MRDAQAQFDAAGIKLYAISYDDTAALNAYASNERIGFPLLSDIDSTVIRRYGVQNTEVSKEDTLFYGIPFPGVFVCDSNGQVIAKFFHDSYKKRDSAESIIDAVRGRIELNESTPRAECTDDDITISATVHGGRGTIRQGVIRKLVVRFELAEGLHIYDAPVPEGMVATHMEVTGPPGLVIGPIKKPATESLSLRSPAVELQVWSGTTDFVFDIYGIGELVSEVRPLDADSTEINVAVRYQACNDETCLLPQQKTLQLSVPLEVVDVPAMAIHMGHGQREGSFDAKPHMQRLVARKAKTNPWSVPGFIWKNIKLQFAARKRGPNNN